jgi:hypothetical protein
VPKPTAFHERSDSGSPAIFSAQTRSFLPAALLVSNVLFHPGARKVPKSCPGVFSSTDVLVNPCHGLNRFRHHDSPSLSDPNSTFSEYAMVLASSCCASGRIYRSNILWVWLSCSNACLCQENPAIGDIFLPSCQDFQREHECCGGDIHMQRLVSFP